MTAYGNIRREIMLKIQEEINEALINRITPDLEAQVSAYEGMEYNGDFEAWAAIDPDPAWQEGLKKQRDEEEARQYKWDKFVSECYAELGLKGAEAADYTYLQACYALGVDPVKVNGYQGTHGKDAALVAGVMHGGSFKLADFFKAGVDTNYILMLGDGLPVNIEDNLTTGPLFRYPDSGQPEPRRGLGRGADKTGYSALKARYWENIHSYRRAYDCE
jgi:hypothetical protein